MSVAWAAKGLRHRPLMLEHRWFKSGPGDDVGTLLPRCHSLIPTQVSVSKCVLTHLVALCPLSPEYSAVTIVSAVIWLLCVNVVCMIASMIIIVT